MDFLSHEYISALLSTQAQVSLTEKLIIVAVVWATMGRKVSKRFKEFQTQMEATLVMFRTHLTAIEDKFDKGIYEMKAMKETVSEDLEVNSGRLLNVENGIGQLNNRVERLENKGE